MYPTKTITAAEFDSLVRQNYRAVYLVAYSRLANPDHAEDVAQESFLRAFLALDQLHDVDRFANWVCRIARNLAIDWLRSPAHNRHLLGGPDAEVEVSDLPDERGSNPRELAAQAETRQRTAAVLAQLDPEIREVLLLHTVEELSFREIGERLGIHATTVRYRLGKATARCRQLLRNAPDVSAAVAPRQSALAKCGAAVAVVAAMSAGARQALAAKAISSTAAATASLGAGVTKVAVLLSQPFTSAAFLGGIIMGSKQIAVAVAGAVLLAGGGAYYVAEHGLTSPSQKATVIGPVTIRPSAPGTRRGSGYVVDKTTVFTSATLGEVLSFTNHSTRERTVEAPDLPQDRFDVTVKMEGAFYDTLSRTICETYGLQVRRETQERDVLVLTAPNGRPAALRKPTTTDSSGTNFEDEGFKTRNMHIGQFYHIVEIILGKPVIDETGIPRTENFDYEFSWKGAGKNQDLMARAVRDQLGFELTPARRPVEILFIEKKR
jgi:RNA polymerase sigma-70 factor, ECF subfamily